MVYLLHFKCHLLAQAQTFNPADHWSSEIICWDEWLYPNHRFDQSMQIAIFWNKTFINFLQCIITLWSQLLLWLLLSSFCAGNMNACLMLGERSVFENKIWSFSMTILGKAESKVTSHAAAFMYQLSSWHQYLSTWGK